MRLAKIIGIVTGIVLAASAAGVCPAGQSAAASITVQVNKPGHKVSPLLWGIFFEDINLSADGGIYPELVRNRSFEDSDKPDFWKLDGQGEMAIDNRQPLTPINRRSLRVQVNGDVSLLNEGYWGMALVRGEGYQLRLAARAADGLAGPLAVVLRSRAGAELAKAELAGLTEGWKWFEAGLTASDTDPKASLCITVSGKGTLWLDMVSVMPKRTWKGHGLRPDLCEKLADLKPAFLRFPGGCWVEGDDMAHMNHWKETIGDIANRKPLWNLWQYWATHGLGYHEYLQLAEDLGAEPLFCINVGMSHREVVPMDQMGQWVQDALDAIEYANGPVDSVWGGLRARNGHPAPFNMKYIEIGNENGGPAYHERWELFYKAIKARYPKMQLIANVWGGYPTQLMPDVVDEHYYNNPEFFMQQAGKYDSYDRKGPKIFIGEYAVTSGAGLGNLRGAIGEAAFMTGMERNSDVVIMGAYAPLFVNVNHKRWPINLINFDSSRSFGLPSYYVQKMFSENRGDVVLPIDVQSPEASTGPKGGAVGVGTWATQAEFKDIKVTSGGKTLFSCDFADGTAGWRFLGDGKWNAEGGVLRQSSQATDVRAIAGDKSWTDYTYSLKARKLGGAEGFLILFNVKNDTDKSWWNLGGWGNDHHAIEMGGVVGNEVKGSIETGRWYDIQVEVKGSRVRCLLDGKVIHDVSSLQTVKALYASATLQTGPGEIILKVVNTSAEEQTSRINLRGVKKVKGPASVTVLTSENATDENTLEEPTKVAPATRTVDLPGPDFQHTFPANSLTVLRIGN